MGFKEAWPGRLVRTATGECGMVVSRANGTAYVALTGDDFRRFNVGDLEAQQRELPPRRGAMRGSGRLPRQPR
jgi:hypothetical protein